MRISVAVVLLLSFSTQAFAVCEQERNEYANWNTKCETLSAASQVTGVAGGIFAIVTFGASMIPCAATCAAAQNACRIRDEKQHNLSKCEAYQANLAHQSQVAAQLSLQTEQAKRNKIAQINADFAAKKIKLYQVYDQMILDFVNNFASDGWDLDDPDSQNVIRTTRANVDLERNQKLDQLEIDRKQEIAGA